MFGIRGEHDAFGELPMKNCSAMLCTRMWSKGMMHSLPKFAASFKASTSYTKRGQISMTHKKKWWSHWKDKHSGWHCEMFYSLIKLNHWMQQCSCPAVFFFFFTLPDCSLWILVSHTFFTNRRLFIWFLMTLMSKGKRNKDNTEEEESKV